MKKKFLIGLCLVLIVVLGYILRRNNYASVPLPGQSTDEYSNAWVGLSLIRLGVPVGISGLVGIRDYPTYINPDRILSSTVPGGALPISYPWFDHPPMMGIFSGTFAYLRGVRNFEDVAIVSIRKPMLVLGTISVALVFTLASLWFSPSVGLVAGLLYATSPLVVVGSRMVQAENALVPVWLTSLILLALAQKKNRPDLIRLAAFFAGLAVLFKLSGVVAIISGVVLIGKNKKSLAEFLIISLSIAFLFVIYGLSIDAKEFVAVFSSNANRVYGIGLDAVYDLFTSTKITSTKYLTDGWPLVGWLGMVFLAARKNRSSFPLLIATTGYLAVYILFGSASYGWYRIPFLPFLMIAVGYFFTEGVVGSGGLMALVAVLIPMGINLSKLFETNKAPLLVNGMRLGIFGLVLVTLTSLVLPENRRLRITVKALIWILLATTILTNILYLSKIDVDYWYKVN